MTDKKIIFKTGEITYDKEWYLKNGLEVKPVVYTSQFLKEIADSTMGCSLELTHGNTTQDVIGHVNNITFSDDGLLANIVTNESDSGLGYSPEFGADFIDKGNKYIATNGELLKTILTKHPRSRILYNSTSTEQGGSSMSEDVVKILEKQIADLNKKLAISENKNKANEEKLAKFDELESQIDTLTRERDEYKVSVDKLTPNAEAYEKITNARKSELLDKVFGEDDTAKERWSKYSLEEIEDLANYQSEQQPPQGVGAGSGEGIGEGSGDDNEPTAAEKAIEFYKKTHNGEMPSFLKQGGE